jgi:hypothetical protein
VNETVGLEFNKPWIIYWPGEQLLVSKELTFIFVMSVEACLSDLTLGYVLR